jgi:mono/diheme cytochrome c family protein
MSRIVFFAVITVLLSCETNPYQSGERVYKTACANCHMDNGIGLSALIPPLANADYLGKNREKLPCIIRYGLHDTIQVNGKTYAENMPGVPDLSEIQITNLLNFINNSWGNKQPAYNYEEVTRLLEQCTPKSETAPQ